jgi:TPR repeat protein
MERVYPFAMTVDKLYDHTRDPADIDLAITWLRRAAAHRDTPAAERRSARISLGLQYANQGAALRQAQGRAGPGTSSWAAYDAAIRQFEEVLAGLAKRSFRRDATRNGDRLGTLTNLIETYYQRNGGDVSDDDLDALAGPARELITAMTSHYHVRG